MCEDYEKEIRKFYKRNPQIAQDAPFDSFFNDLWRKWFPKFSEQARRITDNLIFQTDKFAHNNLEQSLKDISGGITIKPPKMTKNLRIRMSAATKENVALIKSIPENFHDKIYGIVMRSVSSGGQGSEHIFNQITRLNEVTKDRARLIAVDQTRKITTAMNQERMQSVGVTTFEWIHSSGGAEPRPLHVHYDGQQFNMNDLPIIDDRTGERGLPGQLINCRCRMRPIVDFSQFLSAEENMEIEHEYA